jgi:tape measure domain-containing protein
MATGVELASAWVRLVPSFQGVQGAVARELAPVDREADAAGQRSGRRFSGALTGAIAGGVAVLASSALQGIKDMVGEMAAQVDSTKKFRSTLDFADVSDANIKRLTKSTQKYADQTVYNLGDIRNITAQLASNGVKDFDKLAEAGGNLNAVAGGNAETFKSVGMVITQTAGQGKLTTENWNQLADAIPGASGKLMEALKNAGAYTGNFRDAMSKGEITAEEFNAAILELGTKPVAVEAAKSTETFEGAIGNLQAGIVKAGAAILEKLAPAFATIAGKIAEFAQGIVPVVDFISSSPPIMAGLGAAILVALVPAFVAAATATWAFTAALLANPMTWVVLGIAALVAAIVWLITNWDAVVKFLRTTWDAVVKWFKGTLDNISTWWQSVWSAISSFFSGIWAGIKAAFSTVLGWIVAYFQLQMAAAKLVWTTVWTAISTFFGTIWAGIKLAISTAFKWVTDTIKGGMDLGKRLWEGAWNGMKTFVKGVWDWVNTRVFDPFKAGIKSIGTGFENGAKAIGTAWDKIKASAAKPINFVLDTVWNKGLRSFWNDMTGKLGLKNLQLPEAKLIKYKTGGVLPGYTPGRDVHEFYSPTAGRLALSGGEAIMRPEFTRAVGGAAGVARLNKMAMQGHAFAGGGVIDWLGHAAGDVWDTVKNTAGALGDFMSNPAKAVQKYVIDGIISPLTKGGGDNVFMQMAASLPAKLVKSLIPRLTAPAGTGKGTAGMGWSKMWAMIHAAYPSLVMTSNYRSPGANAAVGGAKGSYHTLGRALDLIPASMDTFNKIAKMFPNASELIYTPAGSRQLRMGKSFSGWSAAVRAMHYNHIHLAMKNGGVLPGLQRGGTITGAGSTIVGENGPELLHLPKGAQVNPEFDDIEDVAGVTFNNYAPLGQTPAQALTQFSNRAKGLRR